MKAAYVDTSCLVAIAFAERDATALARRLRAFDVLAASDLLAAELRSAFLREGVPHEPEMLGAVSWVVPDRPLHPEIRRVLDAGYVRGAHCWHLAAALYLAGRTIYILDEPTTGLHFHDVQQLLTVLLRLRDHATPLW